MPHQFLVEQHDPQEVPAQVAPFPTPFPQRAFLETRRAGPLDGLEVDGDVVVDFDRVVEGRTVVVVAVVVGSG